jgi:D-alanyl-D-alanine carboxypeptidase/D-alanyl-D-alanine-endopeptidase (penicillin-binding protein 4)
VNNAYTTTGDADELRIARDPGDTLISLHGRLGAGTRPQTIPMAVEDPAHNAAWRFIRLLKERGVTFRDGPAFEYTGGARHREPSIADEPAHRSEPVIFRPGSQEIARLLPPPLIEDVRFLMKQSQNQHAEVLLRRLGLVDGNGSRAEGLAIVEAMLAESGADRRAWDLYDGSGMSVYNRVTPRLVTRFLQWTGKQPWGEAFRDTLPVGGVDGTLAGRFRGTALEGRIFAKTGTLEDTNALAGFMLTRRGEMLIFSAYANDRPSASGSAAPALDAALVAIATTR